MKREEFETAVTEAVGLYLDDKNNFDSNAQLRVDPSTLEIEIVNGSDMLAEIEDSNEAVEDAAGAQGAANEEATEFQVKQNPDFYAMSTLTGPNGVDSKGIAKVVAAYFK